MNQSIELGEDYKEVEVEEGFSYGEILALLIASGEVVLVIPVEMVERIKTGIKNRKAKQNTFLKENNLPQDESTLHFSSSPSPLGKNLVDFRIVMKEKTLGGIVKVLVPTTPAKEL